MHGSARNEGTAGLTLASSIEWKDDDRRRPRDSRNLGRLEKIGETKGNSK